MRSENHIGKQISIFLTSAKLKKVWLATVLGVDESYLVRLLKKANIKTDRLQEICDATEHNFFKDYADWWDTKQASKKKKLNKLCYCTINRIVCLTLLLCDFIRFARRTKEEICYAVFVYI